MLNLSFKDVFERLSATFASQAGAEDFKMKKGLPLEKYHQLLLIPHSWCGAGSSCCPACGIPPWSHGKIPGVSVFTLPGLQTEE